MFSINTNLGAMAALQSLSSTQAQLQTTQSRISTGQKVSSAADNPAIYAISQTMNATISGLTAVSDNLNFAQSAVSVASASATQISKQLADLKAAVTQGQTTGIDTNTINDQITSIISNINAFADAATFNDVNIAGGTAGSVSLTVTKDVTGTTTTISAQDMTSTGLGLDGLAVASGGFAVSSDSTTAFVHDDIVKLTGVDESGAAMNWHFVLSDGSAASATAPASDASNKVIFVNFDSTNDSTAAVLSKFSTAMQKEGFGATLAGSDGPDTDPTATYAPAYEAGNLVITGHGITATDVSGVTATGVAQAGVTGATAAIATVDNAVDTLNGLIAVLGQNTQQLTGLQTFTKSLSDSLSAGLGALTDADMAAESARLQSLQTKQQLGIQALSIANQQPQALLKLFG